MLEISAQLDRVIPLDPREMFRPVYGLVGLRAEGISLNAADVATITKMVEIDIRHTEVSRTERTGVDAQALGINFVVYIEQVGEPGIAESALQDFVIAYIPGPTYPCHLCPRRCDRVEKIGWMVTASLEAGKRRSALKAISEQIADRKSVMLAQFVIEFDAEFVVARGRWNILN